MKKIKPKDLDYEIEFYERLLEKRPHYIDALMALGEVYTQRGLYQKGLEVDKRLVQIKEKDPIVFYNLACSYSLLEKIDESIEALLKAISLGYDDFRHMQFDPDLKNIQKDKRFQEIIKQAKDAR
jgi:tetratricopeptide (TPR) repeat protein